MRISFSHTYQKMGRDIERKKADIDRLSTVFSSGSKLLKQSDDPLAWAEALDFRQSLRELGAFKENVDFATGWCQVSETALDQVSDLVVQARDVGIQAMSSNSAEERSAQVSRINQIIREAVNQANSQYRDQYIFSGTDYDVAPFQITEDASGNVTAISLYQGNAGTLDVRVGNSARQPVNLKGDETFAAPGADVLQDLLKLKEAIAADDPDAIEQHAAALEKDNTHIQNSVSLVGSRMEAMERRKEVLDKLDIDKQAQLSDIADADMVETITDLKQKEVVFEAVLRVTSMVADLNLTKFL